MKNRFFKVSACLLVLTLSFSCSQEEEILLGNENSEITSLAEPIELDEGIISFDSKETLGAFLDRDDQESTIQKFTERGFSSLRPNFTDLDGQEVETFLANKSSKLLAKGKLYTSKSKVEDVDLDDEIIADSKYASILSEKREIIVDGMYYIYTTNGLYFCKTNKKNKLKNYLEELEANSEFTPSAAKQKNVKFSSKEQTGFKFTKVEGITTKIDEDISLFVTENQIGFEPNIDSKENSDNLSSSGKNTVLDPLTFPLASYSENSLFQQIFGNRVDVNQYHDSKHRIKTKFWNQNYLLWSSVGSQAKYQKKRGIGWSESGTSNGVRLGINHAVYTYKSNISPYNANDPKKIVMTYKGVSYDLYGNVVTKYPINAGNWPINPTDIVGELEITIFGNEVYYPLTGKTANKTINNLIKQAANSVPGFFNDSQNNKNAVKIVKFLPTKFKVVENATIKKHASKASITFDFNFLLSFKSGSGAFQTLTNQLNAKKYSSIEIDIYGAALRNNIWLGTRIQGNAK